MRVNLIVCWEMFVSFQPSSEVESADYINFYLNFLSLQWSLNDS